MNLSIQIAKQFKEVYLSGRWIAATNLKEQLTDISWEEATTKIGDLNTIAALTYHINYYVAGMNNVLKGGTLNVKDKYSFDLPPIQSKEDWEKLLNKVYSDGEEFTKLVEQFPDEKLLEGFVDKKYGNNFRNITAMIEHTYYHFGQIVLLKKLIKSKESSDEYL